MKHMINKRKDNLILSPKSAPNLLQNQLQINSKINSKSIPKSAPNRFQMFGARGTAKAATECFSATP